MYVCEDSSQCWLPISKYGGVAFLMKLSKYIPLPSLWLTSLSKTLFLSCPTPVPLRTEEHRRKNGMKLSRTLGGLSGYKPLSVPHFLFDLPHSKQQTLAVND